MAKGNLDTSQLLCEMLYTVVRPFNVDLPSMKTLGFTINRNIPGHERRLYVADYSSQPLTRMKQGGLEKTSENVG
jgi:hypothetical protein